MPSLNYTFAGTLTFPHTQNKETICTVLTIDNDSVKALGSQRIFQSDTTQLLPCLGGLFPPSDLWYSSQSPSHRPSTPRLRELREVFSWSSSHWVLCRWLAGVYQRITTPLFLMVINCHISFLSSLIVTGPLYHNHARMSSVYVIYFYFFCSVSYWPTPYYITVFLFVKRGREVVPVGLDVQS